MASSTHCRLALIVALLLFGSHTATGQGQPPSPREAAPVDLTGYWVSLVTEDWIDRMSPDSPPTGAGGRGGRGGRGDATPATTDPCRAYGAGGSMRMPGRLFISWADDDTLQVEMDQGTQTRLFRFDSEPPPGEANSLQGYSSAQWLTGGGGRGGRGGRGAPPPWGALEVVTTHLSGGFLLTSRSNYAPGTGLREIFARHDGFGEEYLTVVASLEGGPTVSSTFKKEPNGDNFIPTGCTIVPQN